jgi:cell division protein FtsW (lipid II flippase)
MESLLRHFKKFDWILVFVSLSLLCVGFLAIYNTCLSSGDFSNLHKQIIFSLIGIFLMVVASFFDWRNFRTNPYLILVLYSVCVLKV